MQNSKQKAPFAYAKTCKSKQKGSTQQPKIEPTLSPRSKRCENIYQQLMNQLDIDESQYILKLCKKNQIKMKRKEEEKIKSPRHQNFKDVTNVTADFSQKSIKNTLKQSNIPTHSKQASNLSIIKPTKKQIKQKKESSRKVEIRSQSSQSRRQSAANPYFLNNLDHYIAKLNKNQNEKTIPQWNYQKSQLHRYQSQGQREFRKTVEVKSSNKCKQGMEMVSRAKYSKLLDKLHEELVQKEALEYKLECKEMKIGHMNTIIESMYGEIATLRRHLEEQKQERTKYSCMMEEFATKVQNVRRSKQKHYIPQHQKRNSHVPPSSSYQHEFDGIFDKTNWQNVNSTAILKHRERLKQKQESSTLKKKGMHKYKMSQNFMDFSESDKASISHDSYL